jgi:hypothetical protein
MVRILYLQMDLTMKKLSSKNKISPESIRYSIDPQFNRILNGAERSEARTTCYLGALLGYHPHKGTPLGGEGDLFVLLKIEYGQNLMHINGIDNEEAPEESA